MIALLILLIVCLAMMQTALVSISAGMTNVLRDEAVGIADVRMDDARNTPFDLLVNDAKTLSGACPSGFSSKGVLVQRTVRNAVDFNFCTYTEVTSVDTNNKQVTVKVGWKWKGDDYTHTISSLVMKPS